MSETVVGGAGEAGRQTPCPTAGTEVGEADGARRRCLNQCPRGTVGGGAVGARRETGRGTSLLQRPCLPSRETAAEGAGGAARGIHRGTGTEATRRHLPALSVPPAPLAMLHQMLTAATVAAAATAAGAMMAAAAPPPAAIAQPAATSCCAGARVGRVIPRRALSRRRLPRLYLCRARRCSSYQGRASVTVGRLPEAEAPLPRS